jgi:hypothetical protein
MSVQLSFSDDAMKKQNNFLTDTIFIVQMGLAFLLGGSQFVRELTSTQGVSSSMFLFTSIFFALLGWMAVIAYRKRPGRMAIETVIVYFTSVIVYSTLLIETYIKAPVFWETSDWVTASLVIAGVMTTAIIARLKNWDSNEPYLKTCAAVAFKAIPQLLLAYKIFQVGNTGVSGLWILSFHCFTISRLVPLFLLNRASGWDRLRKSMLLSEIGNEGSWCVVTLAWLSG